MTLSTTFRAIHSPTADDIGRIADLDPFNPFVTNEYASVRRAIGAEVLVMVEADSGTVAAGCLAFLTRGRLNSRLEITSLPPINDENVFWNGLFVECRNLGVSALSVNSFASMRAVIPRNRQPASEKKRIEYVLDLTVPNLSKLVNRRHNRQIKAARAAHLELRASDDASAREIHVNLSNASLDRRRRRGESVISKTMREEVDAFLDNGAGRILQAVQGSEVLSSLLIAQSRLGAYGQSSGTSDEGRKVGASHFLFFETAAALRSEGFKVFNLGGADQQSSGLREFKLGMGSIAIELESAEFFTGNMFKRAAARAAALLRR